MTTQVSSASISGGTEDLHWKHPGNSGDQLVGKRFFPKPVKLIVKNSVKIFCFESDE